MTHAWNRMDDKICFLNLNILCVLRFAHWKVNVNSTSGLSWLVQPYKTCVGEKHHDNSQTTWSSSFQPDMATDERMNKKKKKKSVLLTSNFLLGFWVLHIARLTCSKFPSLAWLLVELTSIEMLKNIMMVLKHQEIQICTHLPNSDSESSPPAHCRQDRLSVLGCGCNLD